MLTPEELDHALHLLLHQEDANVVLGWEILRGHPAILSKIRIELFLLYHLACPHEIAVDLSTHLAPLFDLKEWVHWKQSILLFRAPYSTSKLKLNESFSLCTNKRSLFDPIFRQSARLALSCYEPIAVYMDNGKIPFTFLRDYLLILHQAVPTHAPTLVLLGQWHIQQEKAYITAKQWFQKALIAAPKQASYHHLMGKLYLEHLAMDTSAINQGIAFLHQAHQLDPTTAKYGYDWAKALHQTGQQEALHQALHQLKNQFNRYRPGLLWAGCYWLYEQQDLEATRFYHQRLDRLHSYPYDAETFVFLGVGEILLHHNSDAAAYLLDSIRHTEVPPSQSACLIAFTHLVLYCDDLPNAAMLYEEYQLGQALDALTALVPQQQAAFQKAHQLFLTNLNT